MPETPPFSPTVTLLTLARVWEAALGEALRPLGLTTRRYGLLGHVRATPGISFSELARRSRITVQSVHTTVAGFAAEGLVEVVTEQVGAASRLRVTDAGERLLSAAGDEVARLDEDFSTAHPALTDVLRAHLVETVTSPM
ncbi:MarR family winged helix-turn-helix transcriptional regulator [Auraticoccus monumenti]|uniref:DNA-binding transcriptional regulator, MarR family n=1 Tax=Auraticoccus monumenti TaxID=675864 RepID=A0A1G7EA34_9ACTN|nr:helix-turn-helix domain-containing protein [Auraticoccus monumenti]SDE60542.1 DNA-binding transcriptional regulator, MarR family [Auraticoccus monumenti]